MFAESRRNRCSIPAGLMLIATVTLAAASSTDLLPPARETAVIQKYCGGCHSDALNYGGLSVQHFDAAHPDPTVAAMLLNKVTSGHTPNDVTAAGSAEILKMMRASAMGAAGIGVPEQPTQVALSRTLARQSEGANQWNIVKGGGAGDEDRTTIASMVQEKPSDKRLGATDSYRVIVTCRTATGSGEIKIAWADPAPKEGQMMRVAVDGAAAFQHKIEGGRAQGNGNNGPGATVLKIPLPLRTLTISSLFSDGDVVFAFDELDRATRRNLSACFPPVETLN